MEPYTSPGQEGNGLRRPEAFSLKDGNLVVTASMIDSNLVSGEWLKTSIRLLENLNSGSELKKTHQMP